MLQGRQSGRSRMRYVGKGLLMLAAGVFWIALPFLVTALLGALVHALIMAFGAGWGWVSS